MSHSGPFRGGSFEDGPLDPFAGDPNDPVADLASLDDDDDSDDCEPLSIEEREQVLTDLTDLEVFRALLEPRDVRGLVVDCDDCSEPHYFDWDLLLSNLRAMLDEGTTRVHEPACEPDPEHYVSWEYARGYADGALEASERAEH